MKHRIAVLNRRLSKLYDDRMEGVISDEFYFEKRDAWQKELDDTLFAFNKTASSNRTLIDRANLIIELKKRRIFIVFEPNTKRKSGFDEINNNRTFVRRRKSANNTAFRFLNLLNCLKSHKLENIRLYRIIAQHSTATHSIY